MPTKAPQVPAPVELLPGRLYWAPMLGRRSASGLAGEAREALDLCRHGLAPEREAGVYKVCHLPRAVCGHAFGPLGLADLLRFCRGLDAALEAKAPGSRLFLLTPRGDAAYRANACVLLGAYLVLRHRWSAGRLIEVLGKQDANARFTCSWAQSDEPLQDRVLHVCDCWRGVELARDLNWIQTRCIEDDLKMGVACSQYEKHLAVYDVCWLTPYVMVGADPVTTARDPNPATFSEIFPSNDEPAADEEQSERPLAFVELLQRGGIGLVVRCNFDNEPGMPGRRSYQEEKFKEYGISQANIRVSDFEGGVPEPSDVARMIEVCKDCLEPPPVNSESATEIEIVTDCGEPKPTAGVFVHCKGGFGRSVVLACCMVAERMDVPGAALLGWSRIARPGAVTTRSQELFLSKIKGRADVRRYAGLSFDAKEQGGLPDASPSCSGCAVQ